MLVVAAACRDDNGRWLLHRRPAGKDHAGLWEYPGGKVEPGETVRAALVREMHEESGLHLDPGSLEEAGFAVSEDAAWGRGIVLLLYRCTRWSGALDAKEGGIFQWFHPGEVAALAMPPLDRLLTRQMFEKSD